MELMELPDDELVEVLSYLDDARQLLGLRVLCRRLRDVVLHPDIWRRHSLNDVELKPAVLRLVPCLRDVSIESVEHATLAASDECCCGVATLLLRNAPCDLFAAVLLRQAELGRLKVLMIQFMAAELTADSVRRLLDAIEANSGALRNVTILHNLHPLVMLHTVHPELPFESEAKPSFLKSLRIYTTSKRPELLSLLRNHAATLEKVHVTFHSPDVSLLQSLLAALVKVRDLTCPWLPDMRVLLQCHALRVLSIAGSAPEATVSPAVFLDNACAYLREARQLRRLTISIPPGVSPADVRPMARALASSWRSDLEDLCLEEVWQLPIQLLATSLGGLRNLKSLTVDPLQSPMEEFLGIMEEAEAPSLRELCFSSYSSTCPHWWLHHGMLELLRCKPRLHILLPQEKMCKGGRLSCDACRLKCHMSLQDVRWDYPKDFTVAVGMFAHPESKSGEAKDCGVDHDPRIMFKQRKFNARIIAWIRV